MCAVLSVADNEERNSNNALIFELEELRLLILKGFSTRRRVCSPNKAGTFTINDFGLCFSIQRKRWRFFGEVRAAHGRNSYSGPHPSRLSSY
jgi:hypothetical protein